jgi:branched-chain amino acid transport system ATP-binding protein
MVTGEIALSGTGRDLLDNEDVRAAYLEGGQARPSAGANG